MKVIQLIEILKQCSPDAHVLFSTNESDDRHPMVQDVDTKMRQYKQFSNANNWDLIEENVENVVDLEKSKSCIVLLPYKMSI
jgi:hypothetical protein